MCLRFLLAVSVSVGCLTAPAQSPLPENGESGGVRSSIQVAGTGIVSLKPTILRLSIPIKISSETAWDATEMLRNTRQSIVERANEMGAIEGSLQVFGFQCGLEQPNAFSSVRGEDPKKKYIAQCFVVADFPLREGDDYEETLGLCQSQLEQLASLLPEPEKSRRSYSVSTLSSGLTSQQLEEPLALFIANVSAEDRAMAFKQAFQSAKSQIESISAALGVESLSLSVSQSPSFSSVRSMSPLESVLSNRDQEEAMGIHIDAVQHVVRLMVVGQFNQVD